MVVIQCCLPVSGNVSFLETLLLGVLSNSRHTTGDVAHSLAAAITDTQRSHDEGRPNKRRRLSDGHDAIHQVQDPTVSSARAPAGYVILARLVLSFVSYLGMRDTFGSVLSFRFT
jgi:hypothetical protein